MKKILLFLFTTICISVSSIAQNIGIGTNTPLNYAKLDISSTTSGVQLPRMSTAQRTTLAGNISGLSAVLSAQYSGLMVYDNILHTMFMWDATKSTNGDWVDVLDADATLPADNGLNYDATSSTIQLGGALTENTTVTQGANNLDFITNIQDGFSIDGNTFSIDGANNRVGIGTTSPSAALNITVDDNTNGQLVVTASSVNANDGRISIVGRRNASTTADVAELTFQNFDNDLSSTNLIGNIVARITNSSTNIGDLIFNNSSNGTTTSETMRLKSDGTVSISDLAGAGNRMVITDANGDLATQAIPANGDITGVTAGDGLSGGGTIGNTTLNVVATNGLTDNATDVRLGGALIQATTITQGTNNMSFNLDGTGDFEIQDNGTTHFQVSDGGFTFFGDDTYWRDGSVTGTDIANLIDDGNDGRFRIFENGITSVDLDANTQFIFNEQGLNRDFRIESDANPTMFFLDAGTNRIGIGTGSPDNALDVNGKISITQSPGDEMVIINDDIWSHSLAANLDFGGGGDYLIVASKEGQSETNGFFGDGNYSVIWNPNDNNRTVRFLDEDGFNDGNTNPFDNNAEEAYIDGVGAYVMASDKNRKEDINKIAGALNAILNVNGYTYKYKLREEEIEKGDVQLSYGGVIAQEIEKVFPEAVQTDEYGGKFVHYDGLTGLFIEAIKEQQLLIETLQKQMEELKLLIK